VSELHFLTAFLHRFGKSFALALALLFPVGLGVSFLCYPASDSVDVFAFVNQMLNTLFFTLLYVQQLVLLKNGIVRFLLQKKDIELYN
jgi:hypothetical protein